MHNFPSHTHFMRALVDQWVAWVQQSGLWHNFNGIAPFMVSYDHMPLPLLLPGRYYYCKNDFFTANETCVSKGSGRSVLLTYQYGCKKRQVLLVHNCPIISSPQGKSSAHALIFYGPNLTSMCTPLCHCATVPLCHCAAVPLCHCACRSLCSKCQQYTKAYSAWHSRARRH